MKRRVLLGVFAILAHIAGAQAQNVRVLKPVDEAAKNPSFLEFRTRLKAIVARQDTSALLEIVHPNIRASFGSHSGIEAFTDLWKLNQPNSELWKELGTVLALGGSFDWPSSFTAPYTFSRWPEDLDSFEFMAVVGSNVRIRTRPSTDAPILATISYALLEGDPDAKPVEGWTAVQFSGKRGYISSRYVRSPVDYRANFLYEQGRWRLVFFVAGD
jgi:hypothetical protein